MSDILEQLEHQLSNRYTRGDVEQGAIAEIEFLRSENATLREALKNHGEEAAKWVNAEPVAHMELIDGVLETVYDNWIPEVGDKFYTSPRIPDGWVMVPKEPTEEMLNTGASMFEATLHSAADFKHHAFHVFSAMIAASPQPK